MIKNKEPTLKNCLPEFEHWLLEQDHSKHTISSYLFDLKQFSKWIEKIYPNIKVTEIDSFTLQRFRGYLDQIEKNTASTINRKLQSLRRFFSWALKEQLVSLDPTIKVKLKTLQKILKPKSLAKGDLHKVLTIAGKGKLGIRNYALIQLMLQAGLRVGEVESLELSQVSLYDRSGEVRIRDGKGRKARSVPLNASIRKALQDYLKERIGNSASLFTSSTGKPLTKRALQKIVSEIMDKAKCEGSAHTLRHTFATAFYNDHKKLVELSNLLGHSNLNTTARYTQASKEQLAEQLESSSLNEFGE